MQMKIPRFQEAHRGSTEAIVSLHVLRSRMPRIQGRGRSISAGSRLTFIALAIGTCLVELEFEQVLDGLLVLSSLGWRRASRHHSGREQSTGDREKQRERDEDRKEEGNTKATIDRSSVRWRCWPEAALWLPDPAGHRHHVRTFTVQDAPLLRSSY